jgi:hypothetical protein
VESASNVLEEAKKSSSGFFTLTSMDTGISNTRPEFFNGIGCAFLALLFQGIQDDAEKTSLSKSDMVCMELHPAFGVGH